jgi:carboxyl-terminal processing protease
MNKISSFIVGVFAGILLMAAVFAGYNAFDRQTRWDGGMRPTEKVEEIFNLVSVNSILPYDRNEMLDSMYRGLLAGVGDPYTQYLCHEALEAFYRRTQGEFVGIGVRVFMDPADNRLTIVNVFRDAPAALAGLMPGDKVISVDGIDVTGRTQTEIINMITGPAGTNVKIEFYRPEENIRFHVDITRARVIVPSVFHEMIETDGNLTGYIRVEAFERPTFSQFNAALTELTAQGMTGLVVDVRNNPGGLLDVVVAVANLLVPEGMIVFTEYADGTRHYNNATETYLGIPLVLLVNERSASASEVLGGAIQDTGVGTLVGHQTFGKGIVQHLYYLSDRTAIKLTVAKYFTPKGISIHGVGLVPDFPIEMDESLTRRIGELPLEEDVQLQEALRVVLGK